MELGGDLEDSNLPEKGLCRIILGPMAIKLCSWFLHRLTMLFHCLSSYDNRPYNDLSDSLPSDRLKYLPTKFSQKHLGDKQEEDEICETNQLVRVYQITATNPSVRVLFYDHSKFNPGQAFL